MLGRLTNWWPESHREIRSYEAYKGIKIRLSSNELKKKFLYFFLRRFFLSKRGIIEVICHVVYFPKAPKCLLFSYVLTPCPPRVRHEKHRLEAHLRIFPREEKFVESSVTCRERICKILRPRILCASETAGCYAVR